MKLKKGLFENRGFSILHEANPLNPSEWLVGVHNGYLYNGQGERLGFDDIMPEQMRRIAEQIDDGEACFILQENHGTVRETAITIGDQDVSIHVDAKSPGIEYVLATCSIVIVRFKIYEVHENNETLVPQQGWDLPAQIHRKDLRGLLK